MGFLVFLKVFRTVSTWIKTLILRRLNSSSDWLLTEYDDRIVNLTTNREEYKGKGYIYSHFLAILDHQNPWFMIFFSKAYTMLAHTRWSAEYWYVIEIPCKQSLKIDEPNYLKWLLGLDDHVLNRVYIYLLRAPCLSSLYPVISPYHYKIRILTYPPISQGKSWWSSQKFSNDPLASAHYCDLL